MRKKILQYLHCLIVIFCLILVLRGHAQDKNRFRRDIILFNENVDSACLAFEELYRLGDTSFIRTSIHGDVFILATPYFKENQLAKMAYTDIASDSIFLDILNQEISFIGCVDSRLSGGKGGSEFKPLLSWLQIQRNYMLGQNIGGQLRSFADALQDFCTNTYFPRYALLTIDLINGDDGYRSDREYLWDILEKKLNSIVHHEHTTEETRAMYAYYLAKAYYDKGSSLLADNRTETALDLFRKAMAAAMIRGYTIQSYAQSDNSQIIQFDYAIADSSMNDFGLERNVLKQLVALTKEDDFLTSGILLEKLRAKYPIEFEDLFETYIPEKNSAFNAYLNTEFATKVVADAPMVAKDLTLVPVDAAKQPAYSLYNASPGANWKLIVFWASWCGPCAEKMKELDSYVSSLRSNSAELDVVLIAYKDKKEDIEQYMEFNKYDFYTFSGLMENGLLSYFNFSGVPSFYMVSPTNEIHQVPRNRMFEYISKQIGVKK